MVERFCLEHAACHARFGAAAREACNEDLAFHLDLQRPVLGLPQPMVDRLSRLDSVLAAWASTLRAPPAALQSPPPWPEAAAMETALSAGDQHAALAIMDDCLARGCHLIAFEMHVIQPALYRIGENWQADQVTVAKEHLATAIVR